MTADWQWQNDALWQACSAAARQKAEQWCAQKAVLFEKLRTRVACQPLTQIATQPDIVQQIQQQVAVLAAHSSRLMVIGTGGASLGGQALCRMAEKPRSVLFLENCDPATLTMFFRLEKAATSWCIISKSGETVETLASALALIAHYAGDAHFAKRVCVVTANAKSTLGTLANAQSWPVLLHPEQLGGRFSAFSVVGLLPAAFAGLDIAQIAATAKATIDTLLATEEETLLQHSTWLAANSTEKPMHLLMAYADRLRAATQWFKQLWAESLGKGGVGITPVTAIGAIDQHSQLQLYLDGPRDKLVTLWLPQVAGQGVVLPDVGIEGLDYLAGHHMGDVMHATSEATATIMAKAGLPMRVARGQLTPQSLASWFARQMLEVLLVSVLLEVDPYSQPAVEEGKILTRAALAKRR